MSDITKRSNIQRIEKNWENKLLESLADNVHRIKLIDKKNKNFKDFNGFVNLNELIEFESLEEKDL